MAPLKPAQVRAARGALHWSMLDLSRQAGVSVSTVKRMEMGGLQPVSDDVHAAVRAAFETVGMRFLDDDGEGWGLRIRR